MEEMISIWCKEKVYNWSKNILLIQFYYIVPYGVSIWDKKFIIVYPKKKKLLHLMNCFVIDSFLLFLWRFECLTYKWYWLTLLEPLWPWLSHLLGFLDVHEILIYQKYKITNRVGIIQTSTWSTCYIFVSRVLLFIVVPSV